MSSIRVRPETGQLFMDFKLNGARMRQQTALPDTPANRKRLQKVLDRIEGEIALGCFDYEKTFGKPLPSKATDEPESDAGAGTRGLTVLPSSKTGTPLFRDFANQWFAETEVTWRRSYVITQRGASTNTSSPSLGTRRSAAAAYPTLTALVLTCLGNPMGNLKPQCKLSWHIAFLRC